MDLFKATKIEKWIIKLFIIALALLWVFPMYSVITNSLKVEGIGNYIYVLTNEINKVPFIYYFLNSFIIAIGSSLLVLIVSTLAGFAFSKIEFKFKKIIYNGVIMCLAVSGPIILIPLFYILKNLGLYNTHLAVILPEVVMTIPFGVLLMRNYFDSLPSTLIESSHMDGANMWQVFLYIYCPLAKPAMINLGVLQVMWSLQDFLFPLMFLTDSKKFTATVAVNSFKGVFGVTGANLGRYNAALVLIGIPSIIIFAFVQKYIVNGITSGAIKD